MESKKSAKISLLIGIAAIVVGILFFMSIMPANKSSKSKESSMTSRTTDATFQQEVLSSDIPVVVDFWAPWCGPCRLVGPIIDKIEKTANGRFKVYKLNVDENPQTASAYSITGIPSVLIFKSGKVVKQLVGAQSEQGYSAAIEEALK